MNLLSLIGVLAGVAGVAIDEIVRVVAEILRRRTRRRNLTKVGSDRYANVSVLALDPIRVLGRTDPLPVDTSLVLLVDIGELRPDSAVAEPVPFPDHLLPQGDIWLDVLLSSADFAVSENLNDLPRFNRAGTSVSARLLLPGDGGPARTEDGETVLRFRLLTSGESGPARARLSYYYRDAVVQSQRIDVVVGSESSQLAISTDFVTSKNFADLEAISDRPRISIITNSGPGNSHRVVVRPPNSHEISSYAGVELVVSNAVQGVITELRERLSAETVAPIRLHRSRDQLINDLREIAPIGWRLNAAFSANADEVAYELRDTGPREPVVHVCRANESDLTLPW